MIALLTLVVRPVAAATADDLARQVVIVVNDTEPESRPLAEYYAQRRGVPTNQICVIHARAAETITRREFHDDVQEPILRFLTRQGLLSQRPGSINDPVLGKLPTLETVASKVTVLALIYGVPLRIESDPSIAEKTQPGRPKEMNRNEAAVDSELALLPTIGLPLAGALRNPFFDIPAPQFGPPLNREMLLVGRLDGPTPVVVRRMIDDALRVEQSGLHGRAYFDARGIHDKGYAEGDTWIKESCRLFRQAGFESDLDDHPEVFGSDYPMTDVAVYAGWYAGNVTGPFQRETFRFRPGAIAYHIHSSSGASVRSRVAYWVGPLLDKGAAATMGNVFEPYLAMTPHVDLFFQRLLAGSTFLEAAYASQPVLSWQTTFVGDPLYRPFATSLDDQIARLEADKNPDVEWAYLRKVNLLLLRGKDIEAEKLCRKQATVLGSAVLQEKLGDLLLADQRAREAASVYQKTLEQDVDTWRQLRIIPKLARAYDANRQPSLAMAVYEGLIAAHPTHSSLAEWYAKARDLAERAGQADKARGFQAKLDELLRTKKSNGQ